MVKSKKILSVVAAAAIAITSISAVLGSTLAATETTWSATDPTSSSVQHFDLADGTGTVTGVAANSWISTETAVASVKTADATQVVLNLKKAGKTKIVSASKSGGTGNVTKMVVDKDKIAKYTMTDTSAVLEKANDKKQIQMNLYGAKKSSDNVYVADTNKNLTMANVIIWTSRNTAVATVSTSGEVTAKADEGSTFIDGVFTDCYGQVQTIQYMVIVGTSNKVIVGPDVNGKQWMPTGQPNVFVSVNPDGTITDPAVYIYDADNDPLTTGDRTNLILITPAMKATTPSANDFGKTASGYLTPTENDAYVKALQNVVTDGIVEGTDGNYYKKVPGTTNVWQAVQFNPTTGAVTNVVPESYIGGTTNIPDPAVKLYKIVPATDVAPFETKQQADQFDLVYPGYLTGFDYTTPKDEYKNWLDAISAGTVSSVTLDKTTLNVAFAEGDGAKLKATVGPETADSEVYWVITNNKDVNGKAMDAAKNPAVMISNTVGKEVTLNTYKEGTCTLTAICGSKKASCTVNVRLTNFISAKDSGEPILPTSNHGNSRWIRIAENGAYSLVMRQVFIPVASTDNSVYETSQLRQNVNGWFANDSTRNPYVSLADYTKYLIPMDARIRTQAVQTNVLEKTTLSGEGNDITVPKSVSATIPSDDTFFILSEGEAIKYFVNDPVNCKRYGSCQFATRTVESGGKVNRWVNISGNDASAGISRISSSSQTRAYPVVWVRTSGFNWNTTVEEQL